MLNPDTQRERNIAVADGMISASDQIFSKIPRMLIEAALDQKERDKIIAKLSEEAQSLAESATVIRGESSGPDRQN